MPGMDDDKSVPKAGEPLRICRKYGVGFQPRRGAWYDTSRRDLGQGEKAGRHNIGKCMLLARKIDISGGEIGLESRVTLLEKQDLSARWDSRFVKAYR